MKMLTYILALLIGTQVICHAAPPDEGKAKEFTVEGIKVILKPSIKEINSDRLYIKGGTANYTKDLEGVEDLALSLATQGGTKTLTKTEFATALEKIGTSIGSGSDLDYSTVSMTCIKQFWNESWKLYADAIMNP